MSIGTDEKAFGGASPVSVADVLTNISNEVRMMSDSVGELQDLIGNLVVAGAFGGSNSLYQLQSLDRLCQNLDALSEFLRSVSKLSAPEWKVDVAEAARTIRLAELSHRLAGFRDDAGMASKGETGDFEAFDSWPLTG